MVANALIYHPAVSHYNRFVATTIGRDKALRTIQYFARFLAWYTYRTNRPSTTVATFEAIKKNFGLVRKAMRLGKFVEHFKAAAIAADSKSIDPVLKYLAVGRQLGYAFYLSLDALAYIDQSGIRKYASAARIQQEAYRAWFAGLTCNIVAGIYTLYNLQKAAQRRSGSAVDAEKAVEQKRVQKYVTGIASGAAHNVKKASANQMSRERAATQLQLLSDLCDLTIPSSALAYANLDDGIVGLAGTVSSVIGLNAAWSKTA